MKAATARQSERDLSGSYDLIAFYNLSIIVAYMSIKRLLAIYPNELYERSESNDSADTESRDDSSTAKWTFHSSYYGNHCYI
jgi:hypothetical protein